MLVKCNSGPELFKVLQALVLSESDAAGFVVRITAAKLFVGCFISALWEQLATYSVRPLSYTLHGTFLSYGMRYLFGYAGPIYP